MDIDGETVKGEVKMKKKKMFVTKVKALWKFTARKRNLFDIEYFSRISPKEANLNSRNKFILRALSA
ncbi:hypothetical protein RRG08_052277 [Elysia crispata]|uniref:Uncharacterized protein n=1 Tax=Elysia crispata TaxID=231223 RepID=A0AAE0ZYZ3_9GAST|nr:hypothetical protein RRG08_052277 [Elysia crispata]